jgi:hypothetical protein
VGSDKQNFTIQQVGELIQGIVTGAQLVSSGSDADRRNYRVDFRKIRNQLGFAPRWTVEDGVRQVVEAIGSGKVRNYRDVKYSNLKCHRLFRRAQDVMVSQRYGSENGGSWFNGEVSSNLNRQRNAWMFALINGNPDAASGRPAALPEPASRVEPT